MLAVHLLYESSPTKTVGGNTAGSKEKLKELKKTQK